MTETLGGKQIVVTGGTGALGGAVVECLTAKGATCHVPVRGDGPPDETGGGDNIRYVPSIDLTEAAAVERFYSGVSGLWATVNLAGGFGMGKIDEAADDALTRMFKMNVLSAWLSCRAAARAMKLTGKGGRIVNVAARAALEPRSGGGMSAYAASKAAIASMTAALGEELKGDGILVNAIAPSILDTQANRDSMPKADYSKWVSLEDAAELIAFLVSPQNTASAGVIPIYARA